MPVLLSATVAGLALFSGADCIDGTLGAGGHSRAILQATGPQGRLLGLDADPEAVARASEALADFGERAVLVQANFDEMARIAVAGGFDRVNAVILDLGLSAFQLGSVDRGFSLQASGPLDMRMNPESQLTAGEIVNEWPQDALADVIYRYGEEPRSRRIARAIVAARPLRSTIELADVVSRAIGSGGAGRRTHPATRVFQALRIRVNDELAALEEVLPQIVGLLAPGGRCAIISFHSLEDRIVKQFFQREARDCVCPPELPVCRCGHRASLRVVTPRPIQPDEPEIAGNPRSRSAKLRIAERL